MCPETSRENQALRLVSRLPLDLDVRSFLTDCQARNLSPNTHRIYRVNLLAFQQWLDVKDTHLVTADRLRRYVIHLQDGHNAGGVHQAYRVLKTFFGWLLAEGVIDVNPMLKVAAPKVPQQALDPVALTDLKAMLATCERHTFTGDRDRALLLALLDTGCRASEFVALDLGDVNLSSGAVVIRHGKGGKFRTAFLGSKTRRELMRYLRHRPNGAGPLWVTLGGKRLTYAGLRQVVRRRAVTAGVPAPSLHSFRRAFALLCLRSGMDVYSLQKLMGHADLSVLHRYLQQSEADLQAAHQRAGPVDRML